MQIVIITDGGSILGMGHVYQALTLAATLSQIEDINAKITFLTKSEKPVVDLISSRGFGVIHLQNDDLIFDKLKEYKPDRIIFDKLDVSVDLAKKIKRKLGVKLTVFTNLTEANNYADVTVMAGMGSDFQNIVEKNVINNSVRFWGPKYWLLRPEFGNYTPKNFRGNIRKIMLMFGGADHANITSSVLDEIIRMDEKYHINIVLGAAFSYRSQLNAIIARNSKMKCSVEITENLVNVAEMMYGSDLIFVSPGLSFFESIRVGTPVICFHQNEFQENAWRGHVKTYSKDQAHYVPKLIRDNDFIFHDDPDVSSMEIGNGVKEIITEILN